MGLSTYRDEPPAFFRPEVIRVSLWLVLTLWLTPADRPAAGLDHSHPVGHGGRHFSASHSRSAGGA